MTLQFDQDIASFAKIKVVGVGGGGCNMIDSMVEMGLEGVEFYAINTDAQALARSRCPNKIQIGQNVTSGLGAGSDPALGERAALDAAEPLKETLAGADMIFITAGLGGGTGTGAAPVISQLAKEMGILTVAIVTKPFRFEGPQRMRRAVAGVEKLREYCDTLIVLGNDRLLEVIGAETTLLDAFHVSNQVLAQAVTSISDLITLPGLINVDFADIRAIMNETGGAVIGIGTGKGEKRAIEAVRKACSSPLLDKIVIDGAKGVLICITGGPDMTLHEINEATTLVYDSADPEANIIFGAVIDERIKDEIRVTIIATGFEESRARDEAAAAAGRERLASPTGMSLRTKLESIMASEQQQREESKPGVERVHAEPASGAHAQAGRPHAQPPLDDLDTPTFVRRYGKADPRQVESTKH